MNITILKLIISSRLSAVWLIFLLSLPLLSFSQGLIVKGVVTETSTGAPLPGVNVFVEGTTNGTITDFDGNYQIEVEQGEILNFSFLGFITEKRTVESTTIDVQLKEDSGKLDEVVVIGYGTTTVKDATGSVSSVSEKDFNKGNIVTPENLLSGRVAGLSINTGGAPGSGRRR